MFTRRHFLQATTFGLACPVSAFTAPATISRPTLGFSLYGMKSLSLDAAFETCAKIGYSFVELTLNAGYPSEPAAFTAEARREAVAKLSQLKLDVPCLMTLLSLTADDAAHQKNLVAIAAGAQVARDLNPQRPPILETVLGGQPAKWDEQKNGMADRLRDWAAAAERENTVIAIKAHISSAVNSPERLLWLLEQVKSPAIQVAYDYSHFELQGIDMESSIKLLMPHMRFVHVKDSLGDAAKFRFVLPGKGKTDYVQLFSLLRRHGYRGSICVEASAQVFNQPGYDPVAAATSCYSHLSAALDKSTA